MKTILTSSTAIFRRGSVLFAVILLGLTTGSAGAATLDLAGPDGAAISVNGQAMGFLPLSNQLNLRAGAYEIRAELPGHQPFTATVRLKSDEDWQRLQIRPVPYNKGTAWRSNLLFAGLGQHYLDKPVKGYTFNLLEAGGLLVALAAELQRSNDIQDYQLLMDRYNSAINAGDIEYYKVKSQESYDHMQDMESLRNTGLLVAGGAIALSVLDAVFFFPAVEIGPGPVAPTTGFDSRRQPDASWLTSAHAGLKLSF